MGKQESAAPFDVVLLCSQQSGSAVTDRLQKHGICHREQRRHGRETAGEPVKEPRRVRLDESDGRVALLAKGSKDRPVS